MTDQNSSKSLKCEQIVTRESHESGLGNLEEI